MKILLLFTLVILFERPVIVWAQYTPVTSTTTTTLPDQGHSSPGGTGSTVVNKSEVELQKLNDSVAKVPVGGDPVPETYAVGTGDTASAALVIHRSPGGVWSHSIVRVNGVNYRFDRNSPGGIEPDETEIKAWLVQSKILIRDMSKYLTWSE